MIAKHNFYERLLVMAFAHQLSECESTELREHIRECPECRRQASELEVLHRCLFLGLTAEARAEKPPAGMSRRFIRRAAFSGIPLRNAERRSSVGLLRHAVVAMTLFIALTAGWKTVTSDDHRNQDDAATEPVANVDRPSQRKYIAKQPTQNEAVKTGDRVTHPRVREARLRRNAGSFSATLTQKKHSSEVVPSFDSASIHPATADVFHHVLNFRQSFPAPDFVAASSKPEAANHLVFRCSATLLPQTVLNQEDSSRHDLIRTEFPITYHAGAWQIR